MKQNFEIPTFPKIHFMANNPLGWFEIPVTDMDRAVAFYHQVFGWELQRMKMGPEDMAMLPYYPKGAGCSGALVKHEAEYIPSNKSGVVLYFSCAEVSEVLVKVKQAGGNILKEKTQISPEIGYMGMFLDSEGNRIALHAQP